jgi:phosphinothricin acetyltransferase
MLQVRPSRADDVPAIQAIYAWYVQETTVSFELVPPSVEEVAARRAGVLDRGLPYLVAEVAGGVIGFAYAAPFRDRPAYRHTVEHSVYVHPDAVRGGAGTALLARLVDACAAAGALQMIALIGDSANVPSIAFHERMGFRRAGTLERVGLKLGRWLDVTLMQRELAAPAP